MEVFAVTIFMSLAFAVLFAVLFLGERVQGRHRSIEQDALLPLDDTPLTSARPPHTFHAQRHDHHRQRQDHDRV